MAALVPALVAGLAVFGGYTYGPLIKRTSTVIGWSRTINNTPVAAGDITFIGDTVHCEDIHHHVPSGLLFTACEDDAESRKAWFPPLGTMNDPAKANQFVGSIHIIDPKVRPRWLESYEPRSRRLTLPPGHDHEAPRVRRL